MSTIMDAPAEPLTVDDMLAVAYSADAAAALSATSARAKAVKALPAHLMTDADRDLRERLLDVHLPRLLSAFRDAHVAGSAGADADLIDGLEHIDAALDGLLAAARSRATDGLTIQSSFLEQRYPVDDEALAAISDEPSRPAKAHGTYASKTVDRKTLLELLPAPAPAASPKAADTEERLFGIRTRVLGMILAPIPVLIVGAVPIVIDHQKAAEYRVMRASVDIPMKIDAVARQRVEGGSLQAVTTVSGELTNRYTKPVRSVWLGSKIYACPTRSSPQARCHFVAEGSGYVYFSTPIRTGLTVPLHEAVEVDIPDVTGVLRSYIKVTSVDLDE